MPVCSRPISRRGGVLAQNVEVSIITTFASSLWLAVLAKLAAAAFGQPSISLWDLVTISVVGGALSSILILLVTVGLSVLSFRRGYDLDAVSTPMVTAIGDMATLPTLFLATFLTRNDTLNAVVAALCVAACLAAVAAGVDDRPAGGPTGGPGDGGGDRTHAAAGHRRRRAARGPQRRTRGHARAADPDPTLRLAGRSAGGHPVVAAVLEAPARRDRAPGGVPETPALVDGSLVVGAGIVIFTLIGAVALWLSVLTGLAHPSPAVMIGGTLLAGVLTLPLTLIVGYYVAILTARFGMDPDNVGVPIITSVMDLAGVACVLSAMSLLGATVHG